MVTSLFSSLVALVQNDFKSVVAYSTCSQLGYMVALCGSSAYSGAFFHLINHGFFKALLFLSSGVVIHSFSEEQDIRKMGGLFTLLPLTYSYFLIGSCSLFGLPFLSGYCSKDFLIEFLYSLPFAWSNFSFHILAISVILTTFYSIRVTYYVFISHPKIRGPGSVGV